MKRITVTALITAIALAVPAYAAEDRPSGTKSSAARAGPMQPGGMGMMQMMMEQMMQHQQMMQPAPAK